MMMSTVMQPERKRLHPHKFTLWVAIASIVMMFVGLTSAYIVRHNMPNWLEFAIPKVFWYSTIAILLSSATMHLALKAFEAHEMKRYRVLISITLILGLLFCIFQGLGFYAIYTGGVQIFGMGSNPSASFLGIIVGLHFLHVFGGMVALLVMFINAYSTRRKNYSNIPVEIMSIYWHFVDILWIYLFIFLSWSA